MNDGVVVTMNVIVHATEDLGRLYGPFEKLFGIRREQFKVQEREGHFGNPISVLNVRIAGSGAVRILDRISSALSDQERGEILGTLEERMDDSSLYLRIGKQEFVQNRIVLEEKNAIKVKIYKPVYRKKEIMQEYRGLLGF